MKYKIYVNYPMEDRAAEKIRKGIPDLLATTNGEQVLAMARQGEVDRVCIAFGACAFSEFELSKAIHDIDPTIPVLVMSSDIPEIPSANEYVTTDPGFFFESVNEFLKGEFEKEDYQVFPKKKSNY
jgi:hypothetical protein